MLGREKNPGKNSSDSSATPLRTGMFQSRPFSDPTVSDEASPHTQELPDLQTQLERGARFNQSLSRMKVYGNRPAIQPKITVGAPGDKYEQEADQMAQQVMSMPAAISHPPIQRLEKQEEEKEPVQTKALAASITPLVQRETAPAELEEEKEPVQMKRSLQETAEVSIQRDGTEALPTVPNYQLTPPSLLQPPDPSERYGLGQNFQLHLDPQIQAMAFEHVQQQMEPATIRAALSQVNLGLTALPAPSASGPTATPTPNPFATPSPSPAAPLVPRGAGPDTPRPATAGDLMSALLAVPAIDTWIMSLKTRATEQMMRDWRRLSTSEQVGAVSSAVAIGAGALAGILSDPNARQMALSQLNGRVFPVPGLNWLSLEINTGGNNLMLGGHVDIGRLLPPSLGFGPSSPQAIGGPPTPQPFVPGQPTVQREATPEAQEEKLQMKPLANAMIQRETTPKEEEEPIQMKPSLQRVADGGSFEAGGNLESRLSSSKGGGSALPDDVRSFMEPRFGADFSGVRVHTDSTAAQMNKELGAQAFAHGSDIYYGAGKSPGKNELTAHELTHTIQQTGGVQAKLDGDQQGNQANRLIPNPETKVSVSTESVEALAVEVIESLKTDPEDHSGQVRRRLGSLEPSTREAVLAQVQTRIPPAQWQRLSKILAEPVHTEGNALPSSGTAPVAAPEATASIHSPSALSTTSPAGTDKTATGHDAAAVGATRQVSTSEATKQAASKHKNAATNVTPADVKSDAPPQSNSGKTAQSNVAAHSNVPVPGGDVDKAATGESAKTVLVNKPQHGKEAATEPGTAHSHADAAKSANHQNHPSLEAAGHPVHSDGASNQHSGNAANSELSPTPSQALPSAMPESPALAQAAQQIVKAAEAEKAVLSQTAQAQRTTLMQQAEAKAQAIQAVTQSKIQAIIAALESKKAELKQSFSATRTTVKGQIESQKAVARAEGTKALSALRKEVEVKRKTALEASENEAKQLEQAGQTEAARANSSAAESSSRVNATANQQANAYSGKKPEVQSAVRQAVGSTASDVTTKIHQRSQELAKNAKDASQKAAKGFRDAGKQLATGVGDNTTQVEKAIQEGTNATVNRITAQGTQQLKQVDALEAKALASFDKLKATSVPGIKQAGQSAALAARKAGQAAVKQIDRTQAASLKQFDKATHQVMGHLQQVPKGRKLDNKEVQKFTQDAGENLRKAGAELGTAISEQANGAQSSFSQLEGSVSGHLEGAQQKVTAEANKAAASLNSGLAQVSGQVTQQSQQAIAEGRDANQNAIQKFGDGLQQKIDEAKQGWGKERQKVYTNIQGKVNEEVKSNKDVESKAPSDFSQLANTAAAKAEESLASKIFSGIWEGIKTVAKGLLIFAVIVGAIVGVASLIAGAFIGWPAVLAIAGIVGIGMMVVGVIQAIDRRAQEMANLFLSNGVDNPPWGILALAGLAVAGVAVGDVLGITPIIEGVLGENVITGEKLTREQQAEKITEGVLTIALMFLFHALTKGVGKPGEVPGKGLDPLDPIKGKDPVDPIKGKEPVKPGKGTEPPGKDPVEPGNGKKGGSLEPGVRAERTTADGHHKVKVTENGTIRCSLNCGALELKYPEEIKEAGFGKRLKNLKELEKSNPEAAADEGVKIDADLAKIRRANLAKVKAESRGTLERIREILKKKENAKLKGDYDPKLRDLDSEWQKTGEFAEEAAGDPDIEGLAKDEFKSIGKKAKALESEIQDKLPKGAEDPPFAKENRVPLDSETFLADSSRFSRTGQDVKGAQVFRDAEGRLYHRDTLHKGKGAEIEVYDSQGKHIGTADPVTGEMNGTFDPKTGKWSTAVKGRSIDL